MTATRLRHWNIFLVSVLAGVGAACSSSSHTTQLDHASLIARADTICVVLNRQVYRYEAPTSPSAVSHAFDDAIARLRALRPSPADVPRFTRFVALVAKEHVRLTATRNAKDMNDLPAEQMQGGEFFAAAAGAGQIATEMGMPHCALRVDTTRAPSSASVYHFIIGVDCTYANWALTDLRDLLDHASATRALYDQLLRDIRAQPVPTGGAPSIESFVHEIAIERNQFARITAALASHDDKPWRIAVGRSVRTYSAIDAAAMNDGLRYCAIWPH